METKILSIDYHSDTPELTDDLKDKIEKRLQKLTQRKRDITNVSIAVNTDSGDSLPRQYRVRVVAHHWPESIAVVEKGGSVSAAVSDALDSVERQVRERRAKRRSERRKQASRQNGSAEP